MISEFMANNEKTIKDDFGDNSDYIELYNGTPNTINLAGYYLTDNLLDLKGWKFPATNILSGQHLLVWASGRDRKLPGLPLHANFSLNKNGESLALVKPDQVTILQQFTFGFQAIDRSYGLALNTLSNYTFLAESVAAKYLIPTNNVFSNGWTQASFNDSAWADGVTAFGFDTNLNSVLTPLIKTDLRAQMIGSGTKRSSAYLRIPFNVASLASVPNPALQIRYDDGFVAYLNGKEIARRGLGAGTLPGSASTANTNRPNDQVLIPEVIAGSAIAENLKQGANTLAIHVLNRAITDGDLFMLPELVARTIQYLPTEERVFTAPTPGTANQTGFEGSAGDIEFSAQSTTFLNNFELTLVAPGASPAGEIRYTVNGSVPATNSFLYTGPIQVTNSIPIRARAFEPGFLPGRVRSEAFLKLGPGMQSVSSDLPLIIVHSFGGGGFDTTVKKASFLFVHEPVRGRSSFTNAPDMVFRAGLKIRGSSTAGNPKWNWAVDAWDEDNLDKDIPLLGMPSDSEWVFHAPYNFDPSLFHNPLASDMSFEAGRYAGRYRLAELYLNENAATTTNAAIRPSQYFGVYNIIERVGVGKDRVDIDKLTDRDVNPPEVTGGYLMSIDRDFGGTPGFTGAGQTINYIEPKYEEISLEARDPQEKYLTKFMNDFGAALNSASWTNPVTGYMPFIDAGAAIDHHLIDVISFNVDALRLSGYFHKPRNGPLTFGPIWDFDRAFGSTDGRDEDPFVWKSKVGDGGTDFFNYPWWDRMFKDPAFWQMYIDRYQQLREGPYSNAAMFAMMDRLNDQVKESAPRDLAKWSNQKRGGTQATELAYFKEWIRKRLLFMDTNFLAKPQLSLPAGQVADGTPLILTAPPGATIYYTTNGVDPRQYHGGIDPSALTYSGPIPITGEMRIVTRSRSATHRNLTGAENPPINSPWSGPRSARYTLNALAAKGDLLATEIHYHPSEPTPSEIATLTNSMPLAAISADLFEYLELRNVSTRTIDLFGARFTAGFNFTFSDASDYLVGPGEFVLLVRNTTAFRLRHGNGPAISGQYTGSLDNNGGRIRLESEANQELLDLTYNDSWHPATDGFGFSLVRVNTTQGDSSRYDWAASSAAGGSPGAANPAPAPLPRILVNEVLSGSSGNNLDSIELVNASASAANISGWYLTDDRAVPFKYRIPAGTVLPSGGHLVVTEAAFNASSQGTNAFQLSSRGDEAWLFAADPSSRLLGYTHGFDFGPTEENVSFGRLLTSIGKEMFVPQTGLSLGQPNLGPKIGPLVIREIHYHPTDVLANGAYWNDTDGEFVELQNIGTLALPLFDAALGAEWHVRGDADYNFGADVVLAPGEVILLTGFNPVTHPEKLAIFKAKYGVAAGIRAFGPLNGTLGNGSGAVRITKPVSVDQDSGDVYYGLVDEVEYSDAAPWPAAADGAGASLQQKNRLAYNNDPANWAAALPTAGAAFTPGSAPVVTTQPKSQTVVGGTQASLSVAATGKAPLAYQWRRDGQNVAGATSATLTFNPVPVTASGGYTVVVVDANGAVESEVAQLTVLQPAQIVSQPEGRNVAPGATVSFTVGAVGTGTLKYQWYFKGEPVPGETNSSITLTGVVLANTGPFTVVVTDDIGSDASRAAQLNVLVRPNFTLHPQSIIAVVGDTVQFEVQAEGLEPFTYRWRRNNNTISGAINRLYRITNVQTNQAGSYTCNITNLATGSLGTNSLAGILTVMLDNDKDGMGDAWEVAYGFNPADPSDAAQDADLDGKTNLEEFLAGTHPRNRASMLKIDSIEVTTNGTFIGFTASTNRGYSLQFRQSYGRGDWQSAVTIPGRTNERVLRIQDPLPEGSSRLYRLLAPPDYPPTGGPTGPVILSAPVPLTVDAGEQAVLEVQAAGEGELSYQWLKGGNPVTGATASFLAFTAATTDAGAYSVRVTDDNGPTVSAAAELKVLERPTITTQPLSQTIDNGAALTLSVVATGRNPLTYQWIFNNKPIPGATASTLVIPAAGAANAGDYRVAVRMTTDNGVQTRTSDTARVLVNE